ncbi:hypothetical protein [Flammeovirga sp. SJP92]|uniref:hypothetical protein n=1 Tax=Flammeovirga sp. SJP92 TaxID=1775430 RepID=UPI00078841C9|nr:hypothetical protein [Flammeovirga sp. SJP92]KXX68761.1 hypothetical protein AVL50_18995 [Flammeovirga sp. SJP92]
MNTQLNTIFSKLQFKTVLLFIFSLVLILAATGAKVYFDVKLEKLQLQKTVSNSKALVNYKNASTEIEKTIQEVKTDAFDLFSITLCDVYYLNDNGTALYWVNKGKERSILNRSQANEITSDLKVFFKDKDYKSSQKVEGWFVVRSASPDNTLKSIVLVVKESDLWLKAGFASLPLTVLSILIIGILFIYHLSSTNTWLRRPLTKFFKHLEYESQGINSELERDVPNEWQELFMEYDLSFSKRNNNGLPPESEQEATQRHHAQLQELRWAKEQLAEYQKKAEKAQSSNGNSKLKGFFDSFQKATVGMMIADADSIPIFLNEKGKELLGKGVLPSSEDDLLDVRKIFISGTNVEMPSEQHPIITVKLENKPQIVKHIDVFNPKNKERKKIQMYATPITAYTSMNEYYLILIAEEK